jgi:hypothetical protein
MNVVSRRGLLAVLGQRALGGGDEVRLIDLQDAAAGEAEEGFEVGVVLVGEPGRGSVGEARGLGVVEGWGVLG